LRGARAEVLLPALHLRQTPDRRLQVVQDDLDVRAELAEERADDAFGLFEHGEQEVFRLDLLVLVALGGLDGRLDGLLAAQCETF
jgi:hypothetical protein